MLLICEYPHVPTTLNTDLLSYAGDTRHRPVVVVVHSAYCLALIQLVIWC